MKTIMMIFIAVILSMSVNAQSPIDDIIKTGISADELQPIFLKADSLKGLNVVNEFKLSKIDKYEFTYCYSESKSKGKYAYMKIGIGKSTNIGDEVIILIPDKKNPTFISYLKNN